MIPALHIVTDDAILRRPGLVESAIPILESGGEKVAFHLRGPRTSGGFLYSLGQALKGPAEASGSTLLVNDRLDIVLALDLPGAHLGQRSIPAGRARAVIGAHRLLGLSVHGGAEAEDVSDGDVDFLMVGTIFQSASHPAADAGGLDRLREVACLRKVPLVAIGGMTPERVGPVLRAGARGVAVRGGIWDAADPAGASLKYLEALDPGRRG